MLLRPWLIALGASAALACALAQPAPACGPGAPFTWSGKNVLWLGTSIPAQGKGRDGYPELFCGLAGCRVTNNAIGGSHIRFQEQRGEESCGRARNAPKALSATRRELQAKMRAAGPDDASSSYHPGCHRGERPDAMGYETLVNEAWPRERYDVVVIDHGRNDRPVGRNRGEPMGELDPRPLAIASVQAGTVTRLVLPAGHGLRVNDDVTIRTPGIPRMDFWTGEVSEVNGNTVTLPFDSSRLPVASTAGGTLVRYDKSRLYDAYNLVISDVLHMNAFHGGKPVLVVLMTSPTEWTSGRNDGSIAAVNQAVLRVAQKWGLPVYDMTSDLRIDESNLRSYLPDAVHPTTPAARDYIAQGIARWARNGRLVLDSCSGRWIDQAAAPALRR